MDGEKAMTALKNPEMVSAYKQEVMEAVRKGENLTKSLKMSDSCFSPHRNNWGATF